MTNLEEIKRLLATIKKDVAKNNITEANTYAEEVKRLLAKLKAEVEERNIYTDVEELKAAIEELRPMVEAHTLMVDFLTSECERIDIDVKNLRYNFNLMNTEIEDIVGVLTNMVNWLTELESKVDNMTGIEDSGWLELTLNDGWSNTEYESEKPMYRKVGKTVMLRGLVNATGEAGTAIATLPTGFRPSTTRFNRYVCTAGTGNGTANVQINYYGVISDYTKGSATRTFLSLNGISFFVD